MDNLYRVGVIGLGSIGASHARALRQLSDSVVMTAFSGGSYERAAETGWADAQQLTINEMIESDYIDIVAICSPSGAHGEQTLQALDHGKHVVVEKPMCLTPEVAEEIVVRAARRDLLVSPFAQRRFEPIHRELKGLLNSGRLGTVVLGEAFVHWYRDDAYYDHATWRSSQAGGGGSLMNQGVHSVDLLQWLLGPVEEVTAQTSTRGHSMDAEDTTVATMRFQSGALGVVVTSTATPPGQPAELSIRTNTGFVSLDQNGVVGWEFDGLARPGVAVATASGASDPAAIGIGGHVKQWANVIEALQCGDEPEISASDGRDTVRLLCGIYEAANSHHAVLLGESV